MQYNTDAVVLSVKNWGEADKTLQFFSLDHGLIRAAAFGCRRTRSPLAGALQTFNVLDVTFMSGQRLETVKQCSIIKRFPHFETDIFAMAYASFIAECVTLLMPEGVPQSEVYGWLIEVLSACGPRSPRLVAMAALMQLLEFSGIGLSYGRCVKCGRTLESGAFFSVAEGGALSSECAEDAGDREEYPDELRALMTTLSTLDWKSPPDFRARKSSLLKAERIMLGYLKSTIGRSPRSIGFIRQLESGEGMTANSRVCLP